MFINKIAGIFLFPVLLAGAWGLTQDPAQQNPSPAADNTQMNQRDRDPNQLTADQQADNPSDVTTTQQIRRSVMEDKSLSTYAQNIKIITQNGQVTLKGPVRSNDEKKTLEAKAAAIVGPDKVVSELNVQPAN